MKKYLFLILITIIGLNGFAQKNSNSGKEQKIFRQPNLEKFYGTWVYEEGDIYFRIVLTKKIVSPSPVYVPQERLTGTHTFKKNGKLIDEKRDSSRLNSINSRLLSNSKANIITIFFHEYFRAVSSDGTLEYIEGPIPKLIWKLNKNQNRRGIILPGQENLKDPEFIVPTDIILHKVK